MKEAAMTTLADVCESVRYGYTASASFDPVGPKFLRITDIVPELIDWQSVPFCKIDDTDKERYQLKEGDIVIARTGATVGYAKLIREPIDAVFASYLVRFRVDPKIAAPRFVGRLVESFVYKNFVKSRVGGAAQPNANAQVLSSFRFNLPTRHKQDRIAAILSAYDDLIENNRRRIQLLEESARLLYKEWFVYLRFPGHEHVKVVDGVPEGWEKKPLSELTDYLSRGITPHYDDEAKGIVINQKCIRNGQIDLSLARHQSKEFTPIRQVLVGDVLINSTGEGTLGRVAQVKSLILNCTVDTHVTIVRPKEELGVHSFGMALMALEPLFSTMGRGATNQTELSRAAIGETTILVPAYSLIRDFNEYVHPTYQQISTITIQNQKLKQARDLMLPRLMNGEIEV